LGHTCVLLHSVHSSIPCWLEHLFLGIFLFAFEYLFRGFIKWVVCFGFNFFFCELAFRLGSMTSINALACVIIELLFLARLFLLAFSFVTLDIEVL
jgi:hypothetical protein